MRMCVFDKSSLKLMKMRIIYRLILIILVYVKNVNKNKKVERE